MAEVGDSKLIQTAAGILSMGACIVIVRTEWNVEIVDELEKGCRKILHNAGVAEIMLITVPGAFEIPFAIKSYWNTNKYKDDKPDAFIALGCVLRGGTPHFEYVCSGVTEGIVRLNLELAVPTIFGILTLDTREQAMERIGGKHGHKGEEAAITAIKMINVIRSFKK